MIMEGAMIIREKITTLPFFSEAQSKRIDEILNNFPIYEEAKNKDNKNKFIALLRKDFLGNIYYISNAYKYLTNCNKKLFYEVAIRLFCLPADEQKEILDTPDISNYVIEKQYDEYVILTWAALAEDVRREITEYNNYSLFWEKYIQYIQNTSISKPAEYYQFFFKKSVSISEINESIFNYFKENNRDPEDMLYKEKIINDEDWVDETPFCKIYNITLSMNTISVTNEFIEDLEYKYANSSGINQESIREMLQDILRKSESPKASNEGYLTIQEAADFCQVKKSTIYGWINKKLISTYSLGGKNKYINKEELMKILQGNKKLSNNAAASIAKRKLQ